VYLSHIWLFLIISGIFMVDVAFFTHENLAAQAVTIVRFTTFIVVREVSCCL